MDTKGSITRHAKIDIARLLTVIEANSTSNTYLNEPLASLWSPIIPIAKLPIMNDSAKEATIEIEQASIDFQYITRVKKTLVLQLCTTSSAEAQRIILRK